MPKIEDEVWSEDKLNHQLCASMYAGERSQAEAIHNFILQRAGAYFAASKDTEANAFRTLAESIKTTFLIPAQEKCVEWNKVKPDDEDE